MVGVQTPSSCASNCRGLYHLAENKRQGRAKLPINYRGLMCFFLLPGTDAKSDRAGCHCQPPFNDSLGHPGGRASRGRALPEGRGSPWVSSGAGQVPHVVLDTRQHLAAGSTIHKVIYPCIIQVRPQGRVSGRGNRALKCAGCPGRRRSAAREWATT
jgi:hypothetical protein